MIHGGVDDLHDGDDCDDNCDVVDDDDDCHGDNDCDGVHGDDDCQWHCPDLKTHPATSPFFLHPVSNISQTRLKRT